jgi:hypothetical protein
MVAPSGAAVSTIRTEVSTRIRVAAFSDHALKNLDGFPHAFELSASAVQPDLFL